MKNLAWLMFGMLTVAACEPSPTGGVGPIVTQDLRPPSDLAGADLAMMAYTATLPTCSPVSITATQLFGGVVSGSCSCHRTTAPKMATAADLVNNLVGKMPRTAQMPLVTKNEPNRSYLIFRLTGEGDLIPSGSSGWMPAGGAKLGQSAMCQWINWIKSGTLP